jgi:hypothetical protein
MSRVPRLRRSAAALGALALGLLGACAVELPTGPGPEPAPTISLAATASVAP